MNMVLFWQSDTKQIDGKIITEKSVKREDFYVIDSKANKI